MSLRSDTAFDFVHNTHLKMFRSAATKIAHNSTIPALAGNQDLRPLQDLITAEKAVIISYVDDTFI